MRISTRLVWLYMPVGSDNCLRAQVAYIGECFIGTGTVDSLYDQLDWLELLSVLVSK